MVTTKQNCSSSLNWTSGNRFQNPSRFSFPNHGTRPEGVNVKKKFFLISILGRYFKTMKNSLVAQLERVCLQFGRPGLIPGSGRSPVEGNGNSLQYSRLKNPVDGGAWQATVCGVTKSRTRLSDFTFTFMHMFLPQFHAQI